jgi:hypothetical protein
MYITFTVKKGSPKIWATCSKDCKVNNRQIGRIFAFILGDCYLWAVFSLLKEPYFGSNFFHGKKVFIKFDLKWVGLNIGHLFYKLIWSP